VRRFNNYKFDISILKLKSDELKRAHKKEGKTYKSKKSEINSDK
jgi:hypothetical protein